MSEEIRPIVGYPWYGVSRNGDVYSLYKHSRYDKKPRDIPYKLVPMKSNEYRAVHLYNENGFKRLVVHRLIIKAFIGDPPTPDMQCCHINGDPTDNRLENLKWVTPKENTNHKTLHGTMLRGEKIVTSKLKEVDVLEIKRLLMLGEKAPSIACIYKVSSSTIHSIRKGKIWKHLL